MPSNAADDWQDVPLDDWQDVPENAMDPYYRKAQATLEGIGGTAMRGLNAASRFVDRYTMAPVRAGIGALQSGDPVGESVANQFLREPEAAPTAKQLAVNAGISEEEYNTPLIANPFTGEHVKVSPAGVVGGVAEAVVDPISWLPGVAEAKLLKGGGKLVGKLAPAAGESLGRFAEERAVKAATGENRSAIKKLAKVKGQSSGDVDKAIANLRKSGRTLLETDEAGGPAVGWLSNAEDVGRNAAAKKDFYGRQIGSVGPVVDELAPGAIVPQALAEEVAAFSREIPNVGKGAPVRKRVAEESGRLRDYGLSEEEFGPAKPINFSQAQELKAQYPWEPQSADVLISDKDASNRINRIISGKMDQAVETAKGAKPTFRGEPMANGGERIVAQGQSPTPEQLAILNSYGPAKQKYGVYKNISDAGTEQAMRTLGRRMISPSSHAAGIGTGIATASEGLQKAGLMGTLAAGANQFALSRGSAFAARASDAISKKLLASPQTYQRWLPAMQKAAVGGNAAVVALHHQLMNSDPEYKRLMFESTKSQAAEEP